jgi:glycosyltransferase involved in cell wall biosynthesis
MIEQAIRTPGEVDVSIVVPLLNEEDNVRPLYHQIAAVMDAGPYSYELILISDGSDDETVPRLREIAAHDSRVSLIELSKRFGQTAAMAAGFDHARGKVIVPMDGDLQNDPADIPRLIARLDEGQGWDIVSGWRKNRQDKLLSRRFPSILANRLIRRLTWTEEIHDFGCTMKAYRRETLEDVTIYGEMHRFLPAICKWRGARITEEVVHHRARLHGTSKYGLKRTIKVLLDLMTVKFLGDYLTKPIYFFGKAAMFVWLFSFLSLGIAVVQRFGILTGGDYEIRLNNNVLVHLSSMLFLLGVIFLMMGVLSELMVRIYHESQDRKPYKIRKMFRGREPERVAAAEAQPKPVASDH